MPVQAPRLRPSLVISRDSQETDLVTELVNEVEGFDD
jgi:hypothetical protein